MRSDETQVFLSEQFAKFNDDPLGFVMFMFPWTSDSSIQMFLCQKNIRIGLTVPSARTYGFVSTWID